MVDAARPPCPPTGVGLCCWTLLICRLPVVYSVRDDMDLPESQLIGGHNYCTQVNGRALAVEAAAVATTPLFGCAAVVLYLVMLLPLWSTFPPPFVIVCFLSQHPVLPLRLSGAAQVAHSYLVDTVVFVGGPRIVPVLRLGGDGDSAVGCCVSPWCGGDVCHVPCAVAAGACQSVDDGPGACQCA